MTTAGHDRLFNLLPAVYRMRDADAGGALQALLSVISEQLDLVEDDIGRLYRNWFVETCDDWVLPYLGELVACLPTRRIPAEHLPPGVATPRREVGNAVANARRKGTLPVLEELAAEVAGWPARAVEFYRLLAVFQSLNHLHVDRGRLVDVRAMDALDRLGGPFDETARLVDVRRIASRRSACRHDIGEVGVFVWRLRPYSITQAPAYCDDRVRSHYHFSILGNDAPLVVNPVPEPGPFHLADDRNVPAFITRRAFADRAADFYGPGKSLQIWRDGTDQPVPLEHVVAADLTDWRYRPKGHEVAVDPELGRIAFGARHAPEQGVWVTYHAAFSADMGGGEYARQVTPVGARRQYQVGPGGFDRIMAAVDQWRADIAADGDAARSAVIEITDSGAYQEPIDIVLDPGDHLELRAAPSTRPVIRLLDWYSNRPDSMRIRARAATVPLDEAEYDQRPGVAEDPCHDDAPRRPTVVLDGLMVTGRSVQLVGPLGKIVIRHCTLVPGWSLDHECCPRHESEPSVELDDTTAEVFVDHSIVGSIEVNEGEVDTDPVALCIADSIVDATAPDSPAVSGPEGRYAYVRLSVARSSVIGAVLAHVIEAGDDSIFFGPVQVARRQRGCLRFCWVPAGSRPPRRYECQPDGVLGAGGDPLLVRPRFSSRRYGTPAYCQLADACAAKIREGAEDESEMGAFHDLFQPYREANLLARLQDFIPADFDVAVVHVT
jgi:hypothetical protein